MTLPGDWTGLEASLLRLARRMTTREFAAHLGIAARTVTKWSSGGRSIVPRLEYQMLLDESLRRCTGDERQRFEQLLRERVRQLPKPLQRVRWCLVVDVPPGDPVLVAQLEMAVNQVLMGPFNDDYLS
jgi:transcriptional regulator with XRE-family HTH domain